MYGYTGEEMFKLNNDFKFDIHTYGTLQYLKEIDSESVVMVLWDSDKDGIVSGYIMYRFLKMMAKDFRIINYAHSTKIHGINSKVERIILEEKVTHLIVVDAGSNDCYKKITSTGTKVLVIDHHEYEKEPENIILVNSWKQGYEVSGAFLVNEVAKKIAKKIGINLTESFDELAVLTLVADGCNFTNDFNRNQLLKYLTGSIPRNDVVALFHNKWTSNTIGFAIQMTSAINSFIRVFGPSFVMNTFEKGITAIEALVSVRKEVKEIDTRVIERLLTQSKSLSLDNLEILLIPKEFNLPNKYNVPINLRNYTGILANKVANNTNKTAIVLLERSLDFESDGNFDYVASSRDNQNRNILEKAREVGIDANGHASAWGTKLSNGFSKKLIALNEKIGTLKSEKKVIPLNTVSEVVNLVPNLSHFALWNTLQNNRVLIEATLTGNLKKIGKLRVVENGDLKIKIFDDSILLGDRVFLDISYEKELHIVAKRC